MAMAMAISKPWHHLSPLPGSLSLSTVTARRRQWGGGGGGTGDYGGLGRELSLTITRKCNPLPLLVAPPNRTVADAEIALGVTESGRFSIGGPELSERGFSLHDTPEGIDLEQLNSLFTKVGFPRRDPRKLLRALEHTTDLLWIRDARAGRLVAFARATGDGVFHATVWDVVVDPSYQGIGLGKALMERLMANLIRKGISNICLYAEPNVVGFYKPLGFITDPDGVRAMAYSRKPR